ncbi:hypothetical protein PTTG_12729 [Puccinia triticina 1-1 BBBD Race 1]|uniref:MOR2-PAG1_N domain-containing protein n=1 Tax=Puccinia triticina (isolate 1-1 / race 1 (BBBD)) TaxID=630390 RepID=A0A180GEM2_PUCT1|nr:hypothetical protein PTTG_12729 [Puccinia triticina 1-1 BBBD Race 1]
MLLRTTNSRLATMSQPFLKAALTPLGLLFPMISTAKRSTPSKILTTSSRYRMPPPAPARGPCTAPCPIIFNLHSTVPIQLHFPIAPLFPPTYALRPAVCLGLPPSGVCPLSSPMFAQRPPSPHFFIGGETVKPPRTAGSTRNTCHTFCKQQDSSSLLPRAFLPQQKKTGPFIFFSELAPNTRNCTPRAHSRLSPVKRSLISHAMAETLGPLLAQVVQLAAAEVNHPVWGKAINLILSKSHSMSDKPSKSRYWNSTFPLMCAAVGAAPQELLLPKWTKNVEWCTTKLNKKSTQAAMVLGIVQLTWSYLHRVCEGASALNKRLEPILRTAFPPDWKNVYPSKVSLDTFVFLIHFILYWQLDYGTDFVLRTLLTYTNDANENNSFLKSPSLENIEGPRSFNIHNQSATHSVAYTLCHPNSRQLLPERQFNLRQWETITLYNLKGIIQFRIRQGQQKSFLSPHARALAAENSGEIDSAFDVLDPLEVQGLSNGTNVLCSNRI